MRKIPTVFKRDPENMSRVLPEVTPGCEWVVVGEGRPTRKYDGTCVWHDEDGDWWARREVKTGKQAPDNFLPVGTDESTGKTVGWELIDQSPFHRAFLDAVSYDAMRDPGTYELCGPKVNGNPEGFEHHVLVHHGWVGLEDVPLDFDGLRDLMADFPHEGIVWHHKDGRMAKLKRRDFGFK